MFLVGILLAAAAKAIIDNNEERSRIAFDTWNRIHPEMRLSRAEFDALSSRRMLNLNK